MGDSNIKQDWIKPKIVAHELKLHSLLGENGWLNNSSRQVLAQIRTDV